MNVAVSVAVRRIVGEDFTIKWPNDIYWKDKKVAGILIENAIVGSEVKYSIAGIGLNVNQTEFQSDAPNPISLKQITGKEYNIDELMKKLYEEVQRTLEEDIWAEYKAHIYRREGFWPFVEREVSVAPTMNAGHGEEGIFMAQIKDILPTGEIVLKDQQGKERKYHYKQIRYVV
jgi:BirA family biotin operon repressor/biotin-[acetyl-CoA-carboxylase] ligase